MAFVDPDGLRPERWRPWRLSWVAPGWRATEEIAADMLGVTLSQLRRLTARASIAFDYGESKRQGRIVYRAKHLRRAAKRPDVVVAQLETAAMRASRKRA